MADKRQKPDFEPTVENRKARRDYLVLETLETGIVLRGTEIKSVRQAHVALGEAFVEVSKRGELWLVNARIDEYFQAGSYFNHAPAPSASCWPTGTRSPSCSGPWSRRGWRSSRSSSISSGAARRFW